MDLEGFTVILVRAKATHVWHKGMKHVITALKGLGIYPDWMKPEEILALTLTRKTVLIMADFSCDHFDEFASTDCLIVGPDCVLECIEKNINIPNNQYPIFNMAMSGLVITTTNMPKKRKEELKKFIGWMGGCYDSSFTLAHTHLVADSVNSEKCHAASENRKPIMSPEWVINVWEASKEDPKLKADQEDLIAKYRLPPFKGLEITLSNLNSALKRKYKRLIEDNGGNCVGSLTQKQTHYVVTDKCEGEKVKCALAWGCVHVVNPQWLEKSVEVGGPLPPQSYSFKQRPTCSTPTAELPSFMSAVDISAVGGPNSSSGSQRIEETLNSTGQSAASYVPAKPVPIRQIAQPNSVKHIVPPSPATVLTSVTKSNTPVPNYDKYKQIVEELNPADISRAGSFLDGCKIYLSGWSSSEGDKLRRMLIKGGATVLTKVQRGVTHIVAASLPADHETMAASGSHNIVSVEWVVGSLEQGQPAQVTPYLLVSSTQGKPPPPSPLSHKGLELMKSHNISSQENGDRTLEQPFQPPVSRKLFEKTPKKKLLSNTVNELNVSQGDGSEDAAPISCGANPANSQTEGTNTTTNTQKSSFSDTTNKAIFQGLVFTILGFDSGSAADIASEIEKHGGSIVPPTFQGVPDYAILPIEGVPDKFTASEVINVLWIEECMDFGCLVEIQYYHQPTSIVAPGVPLSSAIICLSGFQPKEKVFLFNLASLLGAQVQEAFSRKDNPNKGVLRSTHLVASDASGSKYEAAIKWGIPVVSRTWLTEAAVKSADSSPPPHQPYLLTSLEPNQDEDVESTPMNAKSAKSNSHVSRITRSQLATSGLSQNSAAQVDPPPSLPKDTSEDPSQPGNLSRTGAEFNSETDECNQRSSRNLTPVNTKTVTISKDSRMSSSMFPTPGAGEDMDKFNLSVNSSSGNAGGGVKRTSGERSPLREYNSPAGPFLNTPAQHIKIARLSDGRSPFHVDTPDTPLGKVFYSNPDKNTTKLYKKFVDSFPEFKQDSPVLPPKKSSPPLHVLRKQILAQIGGDVEGIEKGTGKLLKGGAYSEWANSSGETSLLQAEGDTPLSRKKSPSNSKKTERRNSSKVNELMNLMAEIQKSSSSGESEETAQAAVDQRIMERLQAAPNQDQLNDIKSHPLNKIRPNLEHLVDAEKPSTSSMDKGERDQIRVPVDTSRDREKRQKALQNLEADETLEDGTPTQLLPKRYFMLSSLPVDCKEKYEGIIRCLGGEVLTSSFYEEECTHLVIETPVRNEKLLCCIASGKWILHTSYLDQCYERRSFVQEDAYEWGNPLSEPRLPKLDSGTSKEDLAKAAYRWRKNCSNINQRAFKQMKSLLVCREQSKAMFTRLLKSGGAHIVDEASKCNICLVEEGKVELDKEFLESLGSRSVPCVPLIYLSQYLVGYPKINPADYLVQQYIPYFKAK